MAPWLYKLKIKHHFLDKDLDTALEVGEASKKIASDLKEFMDKLNDDELFYDLEDVLMQFEELHDEWWASQTYNEIENAFDFALSELYDVGDTDKRIWIE